MKKKHRYSLAAQSAMAIVQLASGKPSIDEALELLQRIDDGELTHDQAVEIIKSKYRKKSP